MQAAVFRDNIDCDLKCIEHDKFVKPILLMTAKEEAKLGMENGHGTKPFVCQVCKVSFTRLENLKRHMQERRSTRCIQIKKEEEHTNSKLL